MILLDGKETSKKIKEEIAIEIKKLINKNKRPPHLAAVIVGNNGASITYVNAKVKACKQVGFDSTLVKLPKEITEKNLLKEITSLNNNKNIDGFIVQLPLPKHIDEQKILMEIDPNKDIDGFHPTNIGKMTLNLRTFISATPLGILELLKRYKIETIGKYIVILGRSHIVGRPLSILLSQKRKIGNATVTVCHSNTENLKEITLKADIIFVAIGIPEFLKADMIKDGVTVIDVGITRVKDSTKKNGFRLVGDVAFKEVAKKAKFITPVPGGVGPMTIAMLLKNTLLAYRLKK